MVVEREAEPERKEIERAWAVLLNLGQSLSRNVDSCSRFQAFPRGAATERAGLPAQLLCCLPVLPSLSVSVNPSL